MTNTELIKSSLIEYGASEVILFGSHATGNADRYSDYDIIAVFDSELTRKERMRIASEVRKKMATRFIDSDILIKTKTDMEKRRNQIGSVLRTAVNEGITL